MLMVKPSPLRLRSLSRPTRSLEPFSYLTTHRMLGSARVGAGTEAEADAGAGAGVATAASVLVGSCRRRRILVLGSIRGSGSSKGSRCGRGSLLGECGKVDGRALAKGLGGGGGSGARRDGGEGLMHVRARG